MTGAPQPAATFGTAVRTARKECGWSHTELGQRAGVSQPTIACIEQGKDGRTTMFDKVAAALGLSVSIQADEGK